MKVFNEYDLKDEDKKTFLNISWGCVCAFVHSFYSGSREQGFRYYHSIMRCIEDGYPLYHEQFCFAKQLINYNHYLARENKEQK